jgi:mannose-6-phosphate isomerase-like protein (cupin superfamily)
MTVALRIRWTGSNLTDIVNYLPDQQWFVEEGNLLLVNAKTRDVYVKPGQLIIIDHKGNLRVEWEQ